VPLRLAVGGVFLRHGVVKLQTGLPGTTEFLHSLGFPFAPIWAVILIGVETLGAICVAVGLFTRAWAAALAVVMVVAILRVRIPRGMDFELEALLRAGALSLVALGDGPLSLWGMLRKR
jgi:putative oxidoreductase